ncbi:MAG: hypothetical protein HDR10_03720 [Lachnospiraceae bacterium]|nr:hypothetical protein [Lachnospiraceae bacterium]
MRKAVKMQIIQLLMTLKEAHKEIILYLSKKQYDLVSNILADCQECAVTVGNIIEQFEADQEVIIKQLEEYCEKLFIMNNEMETAGKDSNLNRKKELDKYIDNVLGDVKSKIKVILKVAVFPYKASMWTSLESIWKTAEADEECEAAVVVIPYFELDSQGNKTKLIYEGNLFPKDVPIVNFNEYNVAVEQPDMIFIHNPYDNMNNVTRVPEQYYSYNLKKYTEQLIYSPYGMMGYYNPKQGAFMCCTNGVIVSDKVLVQSERVKQIYIDHNVDKKKLMALGSPKVDAIVTGLKKPCIYPEGWEEKLRGRKVFLLNTHLSYFARWQIYVEEHPGKSNYAKWYHEQIWELLLNRDGCALIWRPHPLMKAMLESRGFYETLEFIDKLEQEVKESENAVLDLNGDYEISFRISDALITTYSSMISEYMISGKPIYIYQRRLNAENRKNSPVDYTNNYYMAVGGEEPKLPKFIQMVLDGEDPLYEERMKDVNNSFSNLQGTIGENIYKELKREILQFNVKK